MITTTQLQVLVCVELNMRIHIADGPQQRMAATLLNEVCGEAGCQFVLGMGDNFYPCGADASESGLNRCATVSASARLWRMLATSSTSFSLQ